MLRGVACCILLGSAGADESPAPRPAPPPPTVTVSAPAGTFNGILENRTKKWLGVPYAEPPVKGLRWRKTVPKAPLEDPLDTKAYGADCAQMGPGWVSLSPQSVDKDCHNFMKGCPNMTWAATTSEDCLFLNIYAPEDSSEAPGSGSPVIVYFPSGAFEWGAGNDVESNAFGKADAPGWKDSLLVTVNYRTGIFGFLASEGLSALEGNEGSSGLFGMHDQTVALKWVSQNIASFGGDPTRVMIFGESAGATSVSLHLVMPESFGLFHAVAIDSGAFNQWTYKPFSYAVDVYNNVTNALGCFDWDDPVACLLTKDTWALLNVSDAYYGNDTASNLPHPEATNATQWGPVVDGVLLTDDPHLLLRKGQVAPNVKVLLGSNADEGSTFLTDEVSDEQAFINWCGKIFGNSTGTKVAKFYAKSDPPDPSDPSTWGHDSVATQIIGDFVMRCPTRTAAEMLLTHGHDVYLYNFVHQPLESINWPTGTHGLGAFHGAEVPFVFHDTFELVGGEKDLSSQLATYWTNFASSGDPNTWVGAHVYSEGSDHSQGGDATRNRTPLPTFDEHSLWNHTNATRPANATHWWLMDNLDCDARDDGKGHAVGERVGQCPPLKDEASIATCKAACLKNKHCGGFNRAGILRPADCSSNIGYAPSQNPRSESLLFLLRDTPSPAPEISPPQFPPKCGLFNQRSQCYDEESGYQTITINISVHHNSPLNGGGGYQNGSTLARCCDACIADAPRCAGWTVPNGSVTTCVLLEHSSVPINCSSGGSTPGGGPFPPMCNPKIKQFCPGHVPCPDCGRTSCPCPGAEQHCPQCIGASAPSFIPPKQCHGTFQPLQLGEVVNNTPPAPPPPPQCINKPPSTPVMCHPKQSGSTCPGGQRCPSCGRTRCECPSSLPPFGDACPGGLPCPNCSKSICNCPPNPNDLPPPTCGNTYKMHEDQYVNGTVYATLPFDGDQSACCEKCTRDGKKCSGWQFSVSTSDARCKFITNGQLTKQKNMSHPVRSVEKTAAKPWPPQRSIHPRKVYTNETVGGCCARCYEDVSGGWQGACMLWEMPDPSNGTCYTYSGYGTRTSFSKATAVSGKYRGARRHMGGGKHGPPPPPPAPCKGKSLLLPKWPAYDTESRQNIRLDVCNVTVEAGLDEAICSFWADNMPSFSNEHAEALQRVTKAVPFSKTSDRQ